MVTLTEAQLHYLYGYEELNTEFLPPVRDAWTNYNLFTQHGVPKNRAVTIWCSVKGFAPTEVGVRAPGSGDDRKLMIDRPISNQGYMWPQEDSLFNELTGRDDDGSFVPSVSGSWTKYNVTNNHDVPAGAVIQVWCAHSSSSFALIGIRTENSSLSRRVRVKGVESAGEIGFAITVKVSDNGFIEYYHSRASAGQFRILGWWNTRFDFVEQWTKRSPSTSGVWETTSFPTVPANSLFEAIGLHYKNGVCSFGLESTASARGPDPAWGCYERGYTVYNGNFARKAYNCINLMARTDSSQECKFYVDGGFAYDTHFRITGYWTGKAPWALDWQYHDFYMYTSALDPEQWVAVGVGASNSHVSSGEIYDPVANAVALIECRHNPDTARKIGVKRYLQSKSDPPRRIYVDRGGGDMATGRTGPNILTTVRQHEIDRDENWLDWGQVNYWCDDFQDQFEYISPGYTYHPPVAIGSVVARFIGGENGYAITVNSDSNGNIQYYVGSDLAGLDDHVNFRVLGYWGSAVNFTEKWVEYTAPASDNTDEQLLSWGAETPSGLVEMVISVDATKTRDVTRVFAGYTYAADRAISLAAGPPIRPANPSEDVSQLNAITVMFPETNTTFPVVCGDHTVTKFYYSGHFADANLETASWRTFREGGGWNRESSNVSYLGGKEQEDWENGGPYYYRPISAMILLLTNGLAQFGNKGWSYLGARPHGSTVDRRVPVNEPNFGEIFSSYRSGGYEDNQWGQTGILMLTGLSSSEDASPNPVRALDQEFGGYYEHWRDQRRVRDQYPDAYDQDEVESVTKELGVIWFQGPEKDTPTLFPNNAYRTPMDMDDYPVWGGLLCIDPNSLREEEPKGPIFFLLDTLNFAPGFNNKSGHFTATINDNKNIPPPRGTKTQYSYLHSWFVYSTDWYDVKADAITDRQAWYALNPTYPNSWIYRTRLVPVAEPDGDPYTLSERPYDMMLFAPDTPWIRDNDEFWVGVQQGQPEIPNDNAYPGTSDVAFNPSGFANNWNPTTGGRSWIMGGWISRRSYSYGENGEITAVIEGKDYMELWKHIPINIDFFEDYTSERYSGAKHILHEVNRQQPKDYRFDFLSGDLRGTLHSYDEGSFFGIDAAAAMTKIKRSWQIIPLPNNTNSGVDNLSLASRRRLCFDSRFDSGFVSPDFKSYSEGIWNSAYNIEYGENIRTIRRLLVDDNTQMITDYIHVTEDISFPRNPDLFCIPSLWVDKDEVAEKFHMLSVPAPSNPRTGDFVDMSMIRDDEGNPAICFRSWGKTRLYNVLSFSPVETWRVTRNNLPTMNQYGQTRLQHGNSFMLDWTEWSPLKFKFRHASRESIDAGSTYKVRLHCLRDYDADEDEWRSDETHFDQDEWLDCYYEYDFTSEITNDQWVEISIPLEVATWTQLNSPDEGRCWGISFEVVPAETEDTSYLINGKNFRDRLSLTAASSAGEHFIKIDNPENYFFRGDGFTTALSGEIVFDDPKPTLYIGDGIATYEQITLDAVNGDYPGTYNVRLTKPLENSYSPAKHIYIPSGKAYSISRLRFERGFREPTAAQYATNDYYSDWLENPKRIQVLDRREDSTTMERGLLDEDVEYQHQGLKTFKGVIDGDLRFHIGFNVDPMIDDPARSAAGILFLLFMWEDSYYHAFRDIEYVVDGTDFYMVVDVTGPGDKETTPESVDAETQRRSLQNRHNRTSSRFEVRE